MSPTLFAVIFWLLALVTVVSAAMATVFERNLFKAACWLFFTFLGMAGLFAMLGADFLAVTQVVVYVGGILTLILFGVLLTNPSIVSLKLDSRATYIAAGIAGVLMIVALLGAALYTEWPVLEAGVAAAPEPTTKDIGQLLLGPYLLPFEVSSITLLIALIGAAYMVRRRDD